MGIRGTASEGATATDDGRAAGGSTPDVRELQETVTLLRAQLEDAQADHAAALQRVTARAADDAAQSAAALQALRGELEALELRRVEELAEAEREARDERQQLTDTIRALRAELEARVGH